jgi:hypothetical protein
VIVVVERGFERSFVVVSALKEEGCDEGGGGRGRGERAYFIHTYTTAGYRSFPIALHNLHRIASLRCSINALSITLQSCLRWRALRGIPPPYYFCSSLHTCIHTCKEVVGSGTH